MMYISAYPIAMTIRSSNVYEERSLGIYSDDPDYEHFSQKHQKKSPFAWFRQGVLAPAKESSGRYFLKQQIRAQLAHDLWWLVLAIWLIMIVEAGNFEGDPALFSVFNVIFETVSGK
jgi:Trk-type K+ transport system membrane component